MTNFTRVLLVEDDVSASGALKSVLEDEGYHVTCALRGDEGLLLAKNEHFDTVVTDLKMPGLDGLSLVKQLHEAKPRLPILLMTAHGTAQSAIESTKYGAYDYLLKPFEMEDLLTLVRQATTIGRAAASSVELGTDLSASLAIIGNSRSMQNIYKEIGRVAAKPVTVLIRGETGTGKELVARAIFHHSDRLNKPFIAINCAAVPENLLESELFGHEKGSFTGADRQRIGRFEQAHEGTLFLDEIGDLQPGTQVKLLRVLQERTIQRVGGRESVPVDVRVIAATHRNLEAMLKDKSFREDLYYRLNVVAIHLPPLRERMEDIPPLVRYFLQRHSKELSVPAPSLHEDAMAVLCSHSWPGNVRELENALRQILLSSRGFPLTPEAIRSVLARGVVLEAAEGLSLASFVSGLLKEAKEGRQMDVYSLALREMERELCTQAYSLAESNQAKAARWLGISRLTMREKLTSFGLRSPRGDSEAQEEGSSVV